MVKDWIRGWLGMLDVRHPGWTTPYDREAFELAAEDVFPAGAPALSEEELDALGGFVERGDDGLDLGAAWRRAMIEFEYIFRASHGSSRSDPSLRITRAETFRRLVEAARDPAARRLERVARALEMRERRRRMARLPGGLDDLRAPSPGGLAQAREAARRTSKRLADELSPGAVEALRRFLEAGRPASEVARDRGISPATMTRALRRMSEIGAEELGDGPLPAFLEHLGDRACWD